MTVGCEMISVTVISGNSNLQLTLTVSGVATRFKNTAVVSLTDMATVISDKPSSTNTCYP